MCRTLVSTLAGTLLGGGCSQSRPSPTEEFAPDSVKGRAKGLLVGGNKLPGVDVRGSQ